MFPAEHKKPALLYSRSHPPASHLVAMDLIAFWTYRRSFDRGHLMAVLPASVLGVAAGWATFGLLDAAAVRLLIGVIAIVFPLAYWLKLKPPGPVGPGRLWGGFWGAVSGFTSFVAHAGGPPLNVYLLPLKLEKSVYIGSGMVFFAIVNLVKIPPYAWLGQFTLENLLTSAALLPLVPVGMGIGIWAQKKIDERIFYGICYAALIVTGLKLLYDGGRSLIGF